MLYLDTAFGKTSFTTLWKADHVLTESIALDMVGKSQNIQAHWLVLFVAFSKLLQ